MKSFLFVAATLTLFSTGIFAQDQSTTGFVKVINGVACPDPSHIKFGNIDIYGGDAMAPGTSSGFMGLLEGNYTYHIKNTGCRPPILEGKLQVEPETTTALVFYTDAKEKKDGTLEYELKATPIVKKEDEKSARVSIISLSRFPILEVKFGGIFYQANREQILDFPVSDDQSVSLNIDGDSVGSLEPIPHVHTIGFLFDSPENKIEMKVILLNKVKFEAPKASFDE